MIYFERSLISQSQIDFLFDLYRNSANWVELDGEWTERHFSSTVGHFLLSEFTEKEINPVWETVKPKLDLQLNCNTKLVYARILKYNKTCFIQNHVDGYDPNQQENDISLILQLNSPNLYNGGAMIVSKQLIDLEPGDAVFYTYEHEHEVKPIKSGVRYVLNLRCKRIK
jgi:predicted 2-oxoglutarate/Fe(II)-dependent dioxygenase YbiX